MSNVLKKSCKTLSVLVATLAFALAACLMYSSHSLFGGTNTAVQAAAKVNVKNLTMTKGKTYKIKVSGVKGKVTYSTSNKKIATVSNKGVVKGIKKGNAQIKVKAGKTTFKVNVKVETPSISKTSISVKKGASYKLKVNGTSRKVSWSTNNKSVAVVDKNGKVTAKGKGQAIITAKLKDASYRCKVVVGGHNVIKCPDTVTVKYGETKNITITAGDSFSYGVKNGNIARVQISPTYFHVGDKLTMKVEGLAVGTTEVEFKSQAGWRKVCKIVVTGTPVSAGTVSGTIHNVKVNGVKAYRSVNKSDPQLCVEGSFTNNASDKFDRISVKYGCYDKNGKLLAESEEVIRNPVKGKTYQQKFLVYNDYRIKVNDIASIKVINIIGHIRPDMQGKTNPYMKPQVVTNSGSTGVSISNVKTKYTYYYNNTATNCFFAYTLKNTTGNGKIIRVYYDVYDRNGKLIKQQDGDNYNSEYIRAGETIQVNFSTYGETIFGDFATGGFSKVVLRVVEVKY